MILSTQSDRNMCSHKLDAIFYILKKLKNYTLFQW